MNIDRMVQGLAAEIVQNVQTTLPGEPSNDGADFEDMLVKQSQASKPQRKEAQPKDKTAPEKEAKEAQEDSTKGQEITKEGQEVAAALVTSQPVVHFELITPAQQEQVVIANAERPVLVEMEPVAVQAENVPVQQAEVQLEEVPEVLPQVQAAVQEPAAQPEVEIQVQAQPESVQPQVQAQAQEMVPETAEPVPTAEVQEQTAEVPEIKPVQKDSGRIEDEVKVTEAQEQPKPLFRQETAAPVKVAENYQTTEPQEVEVLNQVRDQVSSAIDLGQSSVQLQLSPASLGKVIVEITRSGDGTLSIVMTAVTEKTANILRQNSTGLQHLLMNQAQTPVQVEVRQPEQPEDPNQFLNPDGQNRQHQQNQQQHHRQKGTTEDFLQQLRLGLLDANAAVD